MSDFYVIQVKKEGKILYLKGEQVSCFNSSEEMFVEDASEAERFDSLAKSKDNWKGDKIRRALSGFIYPGLTCWARSGVKIDEKPKILKMRVSVEILGEGELE